MNINAKRGTSYYALAAFFTLFVIFLYGPITAVVVLSFQGPDGGLTFPMNGVSVHCSSICSKSKWWATSRRRFSALFHWHLSLWC